MSKYIIIDTCKYCPDLSFQNPMQVIEALYLRVLVALLAIVTVAIYMEQDLDNYQLYQVILACTIWRTANALIATRKCPTLFTNLVNLTYALIVFYLFYHTLGRRQMSYNNVIFLVDNVKPYIQYRRTIYWAMHECFCIFQFIINLTNILKMNVLRFGALIMYLSIQACTRILMFLLELILSAMHSSIGMTSHTQILDSSNYHGNEVALNVSFHNRFTSVYRVYSYYSDSNGKYHLDNHGYKKRKSRFPTYKQQKRYNGENTILSCWFNQPFLPPNVTGIFQVFGLGVRWIFNGMDLRNRSRHTIHTSQGASHYHVHLYSNLIIKRIKRSDFGLYRCFVHFNVYAQYGPFLKPLLLAQSKLVHIFSLKQVHQKIQMYKLIVGSSIEASRYYSHQYHNVLSRDYLHGDVNYVSAEYTINGVPVETVCPGPGMGSCSFGTNMRAFLTAGPHFLQWDNVRPVVDIISWFSSYEAKTTFCLCRKGFGVHKVIFHRHDDLDEIKHPYVDIVLPSPQYTFICNFVDEHLYDDIEAMVDNGTKLSVIQAEINRIHAFMTANEERGLVLVNIFDKCVFIAFLVVVFLLIQASSSLYLQYVIQIPIRNYLQQITYIEELAIEDAKYDVFVSHAEDEYEFVTTVLVPFLQNNGLRKVSFSLDQTHGKPNQSLLNFYKESIVKSKKVIVLLSKDYTEDDLCYYTQLQLIILPLLYENRIGGESVLFVKFDKVARLPDILRWHLDVETLSWQNHLSDAVKLGSVERWLYTGKL